MNADPANAAGCALAFDVGERWIGVAIGHPLTHSARPLCIIDRRSGDLSARIDMLLRTWQPETLVVGDPLDTDGGVQEATRIARRFARQLRAWSRLPVAMVDERHSSREADARHAASRRQGTARRKHAGQQDADAARIILERWLDAGMPIVEPAGESATEEPGAGRSTE